MSISSGTLIGTGSSVSAAPFVSVRKMRAVNASVYATKARDTGSRSVRPRHRGRRSESAFGAYRATGEGSRRLRRRTPALGNANAPGGHPSVNLRSNRKSRGKGGAPASRRTFRALGTFVHAGCRKECHPTSTGETFPDEKSRESVTRDPLRSRASSSRGHAESACPGHGMPGRRRNRCGRYGHCSRRCWRA